MSKHHDPASVAPRGAWRKRRILGLPLPVVAVVGVATAGVAVAAAIFGARVSGVGGQAATLAAKFSLPTSSYAYGTLTSADCENRTGIVGGVLTLTGAPPVMLPGDACSYGARIDLSDSGIGGYVSAIIPDPAHPLPAGWKVSLDDSGTVSCGVMVGAGAVASAGTYLRVENVSAAPGTVADITDWTVALTPKRGAISGQVQGGVTCAPIVGQ